MPLALGFVVCLSREEQKVMNSRSHLLLRRVSSVVCLEDEAEKLSTASDCKLLSPWSLLVA